MKILLVEDDAILADVLKQALTQQRYVVELAGDGQIGWECARTSSYDLILMDVGLPALDGITLCQQLRAHGCSTPILLMTAKDGQRERIQGLDAGADDYLPKPIDLGELQARVRALLRRGSFDRHPILQVGDLRLDPRCCQVTYAQQLVNLTPKEYGLLELFLRHPSRVFSLGNIIEHLWTFDDPPQEESVKSHIKGLRQKLKAVGAIDWIENVYGLGYRLREGLEAQAVSHPSVSMAGPDDPLTEQNVPAAEPAASLEQDFHQVMNDLWQQYAGLMQERLTILRQATEALQAGALTPSLRRSAEQAAHKLAGVLGMFDQPTGTEIARTIEQLLAGNAALTEQQQQDVRSQIQQLASLLQWKTSGAASHHLHGMPFGGGNERSAAKVLVVDDDPILLAALHPMLTPWGIDMIGLDQPTQIWETLEAVQPDLLILDVEMPQMSGIDLCHRIRLDPIWQNLPVFFLTVHRDLATMQQIFAAGADDYISKPVIGPELLTRILSRLERFHLLQTFSAKDPITGLLNQAQASHQIDQWLNALQEPDPPICLVLLYFTDLRQINACYGHSVGNHVLQQSAKQIVAAFQGQGICSYWGNGEFVIGLLGMTQQQAEDTLQALLHTLEQGLTATTGERIYPQYRATIVSAPTDGLTVQALYRAASFELDEFEHW